MNGTKRGLIIAAIILNILSIALNVYLIIRSFIIYIQEGLITATVIFMLIYEMLGIIAYIVATGLLIYSILHKGMYFRQRNLYYMSAVIMTFILNTFSIPSVLLLITLFMSDWVWVKPQDDVYFKPEDPKQESDEITNKRIKERKIAELRNLKDEGKITDEEFNEQLFKLL